MKAKDYNGTIKYGVPRFYTTINQIENRTYAGDFHLQSDARHEAEGFYPIVRPAYNTETEKLGDMYFDTNVFTYYVITKTPEEIQAEYDAELNSLDSDIDMEAVKYLLKGVTKTTLDSTEITEQDITAIKSLYLQYRVGKAYDIASSNPDDYIFVYNDELYKVVQSHTSQADWLPDATPALYTKYVPAGVIAPWVQPTGAQDAYNIGDKVSFEGNNYESLINANVWSPTVYPAGWQLI